MEQAWDGVASWMNTHATNATKPQRQLECANLSHGAFMHHKEMQQSCQQLKCGICGTLLVPARDRVFSRSGDRRRRA